MSNELAMLSQATTMLAEARTLEDVKGIRNIAAMAEAYAKAESLGKEAQDYAAEIRLLAGRKAGEVLIQAKEVGELRPQGRPKKDTAPESFLGYGDLGITPKQASDWQAMAKVDGAQFQMAVETAKESGRTSDRAVADVLRTDETPRLLWDKSQEQRRERVEQGKTVIANMRTDMALIAWAKDRQLFERIDRMTQWGNPFEVDKDGDRETVVLKYEDFYYMKNSLWPKLISLRGKVLGCWCYPEHCHGEVLINFLCFDLENPWEALGFGFPIGTPEDFSRYSEMQIEWSPLRVLEEKG